ncbi:ferritin, middle subunit isoform X1 [Salvelinus sp. IW2-2015]|uniref:ferritin, middle subunit isoform X1 n=1 Tax=Salvelinus sp. IW2-2015 TaxID=2691554 RepID=UPI0038D4D43F
MESQIRHNYHHDCEAAINRMINMEMFASYTYTSMAFYFSRDDVALSGFAHFFKENSDEEREHADKLLSFQNKRGGRVLLQDIKKPDRDEWGNGLEAMQCALQLEKNVPRLSISPVTMWLCLASRISSRRTATRSASTPTSYFLSRTREVDAFYSRTSRSQNVMSGAMGWRPCSVLCSWRRM